MGVPYKGGHPKRLNIFLYLFHLIGKGSPTNSRSVYLRLARRSRKSSRSFLAISIFITSMLLLEHSENPDRGPLHDVKHRVPARHPPGIARLQPRRTGRLRLQARRAGIKSRLSWHTKSLSLYNIVKSFWMSPFIFVEILIQVFSG